MLAVHLKTGCFDQRLSRTTHRTCAELSAQFPRWQDWITARTADGVAFAILGDFNRHMDGARPVLAALRQVAPLTRATEGRASPCWGGEAFIDHILLGGAARALAAAGYAARADLPRDGRSVEGTLIGPLPGIGPLARPGLSALNAATDGRRRGMKITGITTKEFRWPRHKPIANGKHTYTHVTFAVAEIATTEGITGIGLGGGGEIERATVARLTPMLIGEDPIDVERLWQKMWEPKLIGRRGLTTRAISAIDIGLWDIRAEIRQPAALQTARRLPRPRADLHRRRLLRGRQRPRELAREMEDNVRMGAKAVKMKIGAVPIAEDVARVRIAREAVGPDVKLMVDANCAYRYYEAIQIAKRIEEYDIFWFEEPVAPDDYDGHRKLAQATSIPIATGENEYTRYGFRDLIKHECAAILNADAKVLGGVTEFMKVAALAQANDLDIAPHGSQDIHVHLVSAISNGLILEFYRDTVDPMWGRVYRHTLTLNDDGTVSPPDVPGIGADPNYESLAKFASPERRKDIMMAKILIIHGAGMNMRGKVQTEIFGPMTLPEYDEQHPWLRRRTGSRCRDIPFEHRRRGGEQAL